MTKQTSSMKVSEEMSAPEDIVMDEDQLLAYNEATAILQTTNTFLAPLFSLVPVKEGIPSEEGEPVRTPSSDIRRLARGHLHLESDSGSPGRPSWFSDMENLTRSQPLQEAIKQLEGLEKEEACLVERSDLSRKLTQILTEEIYQDTAEALSRLTVLGETVPRRVCQHPFRKNDIVWVCRTCQADETCVLCHSCFSQSDHEGHDVNFYHAQAGGCCDCGDPDAWDPAGFCPFHGPSAESSSSGPGALPPTLVNRVRGVVPAVVDWLVRTIAENAEQAYVRVNSKHEPAMQADSDLEIMDVDDFVVSPRSHIFSPLAASTNRLQRDELFSSANNEVAYSLGYLGSTGRGLYVVLHADDIHVKPQVVEALRHFWGASMFISDMVLNRIADALKQYGQLIIWGTSDICSGLTSAQAHLWMDGDKVACTRVGELVLERAHRLLRHGMFCSISTYDELLLEQQAVGILQWLSIVARSCDPLCLEVAECIFPNRHLVPLLRSDFKMSSRVTKAWYSLLLTLLAVPTFKSHLAAAYCDTYGDVTAKYARGMGVLERSGYTLSVQFLNRVTYVIDLVQSRDLLGKLGKALRETMSVATKSQHYNGRLDPNHFVLAHRRYSPCISDLKCVLNVAGMPRVACCSKMTFLDDWIAILSVAQLMDPILWRSWGQGHIEDEARGWVGAFNASISLGSLFERLLGWQDDDESPMKHFDSPLSKDLVTFVELTYYIITKGIVPWQVKEADGYLATSLSSSIPPHKRCSRSLPFSTVASKRGTTLAMRQLPVSQMTPFSFHLPLHRFAASAIRDLCLRKDDGNFGMNNLMQRLQMQMGEEAFSLDDLFLGMMEFPLLVLSRVAQVRSDLWKRNGPSLNDQVLNYQEPPFCRTMRDSDLLMVQFSVLGRNRCLRQTKTPDSEVGMSFLTNLLLHRLGIFGFVGFFMAPNSDTERYKQEADSGLYPREEAAQDAASNDIPLPWTYSPARDTSSRMKLLEEYLHFIIVFISELPPVVPNDKDGQTKQAKHRLFKEVVHRLASGPKTHSELSEVHHVLSHWDNVLLSEEGKLVNPDDATGAALGAVLNDVADRRVSRGGGKPEPDKWELRKTAWAAYDPAFFHISSRHHQLAADSRPKPNRDPSNKYKWESTPFAPVPSNAHQFFARLRRDATADACVLALTYKVLHFHFRSDSQKELADLRGREMYDGKEMSETAVARALHLLTLAAYAWEDADSGNSNWRNEGGGSAGSIFFDWQAGTAPTITDWINCFLLGDPSVLLDCAWYQGEETALVLLHKLAKSGGESGSFIAQDASVRSGAAWICSFASRQSERAASYLDDDLIDGSVCKRETVELDIERRKRLAKEKALARMNAQAAKFASMMDVKLGDSEGSSEHTSGIDNNPSASSAAAPNRPIRAGSFGSSLSSASGTSLTQGDSDGSNIPNFVSLASDVQNIDLATIPQRLLQCRPRCIICNDEDAVEARPRAGLDDDDGESQRKKSRRRGDNALGFVGYAQASTVLKGGGGPPGLDTPESAMRGFVGTHVALCGHAVHFECCESYLATVSHREDRVVGKRDEFRCPLCQRLSNCLVPFIDVGVDWIESPTIDPSTFEPEGPHSPVIESSSQDSMVVDSVSNSGLMRHSRLNDFLDSTAWWVSRHDSHYGWDGHSAFVDRMAPAFSDSTESLTSTKPSRRIRSLKKKDLYAAWNAMMRTPRYVKHRLRPRSAVLQNEESLSMHIPDITAGEESSGETVVWRRFLDQISDISYKADIKRLGDEQFHTLFGEFRHFVVERHAYNTLRHPGIIKETRDWPSCMFQEPLSDQRRQEMSREKLLSKFFMTVQSFTYSCCCETYDAKRAYQRQRSQSARELRQNVGIESILSRFGISRIECGGNLVLLPLPSVIEDSGEQPFGGRLGKLRYLALAIMSAAGAVSTDLIQLAFGFPTDSEFATLCQNGLPMRAPVVYPLLLGHVTTHVVAAMFATCGRARAQGDSIDTWQIPVPSEATASSVSPPPDSDTKRIDQVVNDCENFIKLGMIARVQQILFGKLAFPMGGALNTESFLNALKTSLNALTDETPHLEREWINSCVDIVLISLRDTKEVPFSKEVALLPTPQHVQNACHFAATAACSFLSELCTILQLLVPGAVVKYNGFKTCEDKEIETSTFSFLEELKNRMGLESLNEMIEGKLVQEIIVFWYNSARDFSVEVPKENATASSELSAHLRRTQGFRYLDWPSVCSFDATESIKAVMPAKGMTSPEPFSGQPHLDSPSISEEIGRLNRPVYDPIRESGSPLVTFSSKKTVPLLGGVSTEMIKGLKSPKVVALPTSYTDLYAELGSILPDCEQTAVCLICGEVLDAGGKGECTRHSYRCGAGAGMFFLLQECSGLIMHKSKAAYNGSLYVDAHGETPQYRGRPLNLDLDLYDHLGDMWFGHGVRQQVVAERGSSRQVILPDFY